MIKTFKKLFKSFCYYMPMDKALRKETEDALTKEAYYPRFILIIAISSMQAAMLFIQALRPGGLFASQRRIGFSILYISLLSVALICGVLLHHFSKGNQAQNTTATVFAYFATIWTCVITLYDFLGKNGIAIFCYMMPAILTLSALTPKATLLLSIIAELLLNVLVNVFGNAGPDAFNIAVNSFCALAFVNVIVLWLYTSRRQAVAGNIQALRLTLIDQMTGLYNRRYLDTAVTAAFSAKINSPVAFIMADIDFFKCYNDRHGHRAGDACLNAVSSLIQSIVTDEGSSVIRYGGEEFLICLPSISAQKASSLAFALCERARSLSLSADLEDKITLSAGAYILPSWEGGDIEPLILGADRALYHAKADGRDQAFILDKTC